MTNDKTGTDGASLGEKHEKRRWATAGSADTNMLLHFEWRLG